MKEHCSRRAVLATTAAASGIVLAGCSSGSASSDGTATGGATTTPGAGESDGGSGSGSGSWTETSTVEMTDALAFEPERIRVSAGTTVTWENVGAVAHTVTAYEDEVPDGAAYFASGGFDSEGAAADAYPDEGSVAKGESYEHTFETTGTYEYYCVPHEMNGMVGTVKVV